MTSKEALKYLRTLHPVDDKAQQALDVLDLLAETADELAKLHDEETSLIQSKRGDSDGRWGVFDTWQERWCPRQWTSYNDALDTATEYNKREASGSRRYRAQRRPE